MVLATEKKLPSILIDETTVQKISTITPNVGMAYAGMGPDSRVLVRKARKEAQAYYRLYHEHIPVAQLVRETATVMQEFTRMCALFTWENTKQQDLCVFCLFVCPTPHNTPLNPHAQAPPSPNAESGGVRPFGVSLLVAGCDENGPQLYQVDPSGSYFAWKASAIGKNMANAKTFLEKRYSEDMELEDAIHTALLTLKEGFEGELKGDNIEVAVVGEDGKFRVLTVSEVNDYLEEVE